MIKISRVKTKKYTGINIQYPISTLILSGKKTIETRTYPMPTKYIGQSLLLIETPGPSGKFKAQVVAIIKFNESFKYLNKVDFYNDYEKHFVDKNSPWHWTEKGKWGWPILELKILKKPILAPNKKGIIFTSNISLKPV